MTPTRRPRGSMKSAVTPGWRVEAENREAVKVIAQRAHKSPSEFIDALIVHTNNTLDDRGLPAWWNTEKAEELPIEKA
ncbi:TPA: hypothetical protein IYE61_002659 [Enterococcus faecium]|nr:hypothetical protein [Enterococcus faecium]